MPNELYQIKVRHCRSHFNHARMEIWLTAADVVIIILCPSTCNNELIKILSDFPSYYLHETNYFGAKLGANR